MRWHATGVLPIDALAVAAKYRGLRGIRRARIALALMDGGAQPPKETWLRLVLVDGGLPRPRTQIRVSDGVIVQESTNAAERYFLAAAFLAGAFFAAAFFAGAFLAAAFL